MDKITPSFDIEEFMHFSKETRLESDMLENLLTLWEQWVAKLNCQKIESGKKSWVALWLPEEIEIAVDETWQNTPSQGYLMNSLALYLCMSAVQELIPQTADSGCAPMPKPDSALKNQLASLGIADKDGSIKKRYAIITYYPFKGGCEICGLSDQCPKNTTDSNFETILLKGYER